MRERSERATRDLIQGFENRDLWATMAWNDIRQRYRRSLLGPLWLTLSMGILVGTLGFLFADLFGRPVREYLPYLALGFILWSLISGLVIDGCDVYIKSKSVILEINAPLSISVFKMVWKNVLVFFHNIWIFVIVAIILGIWPGVTGLLAVPGFFLICINGFWFGLLLGLACVRYRDIKPIIASFMQIAFFLTPIIWKVDQLTKRAEWVDYNPFYHFIELVRKPLLGHAPEPKSWIIVLAITLVGAAVSFAFFARYRSRIPYWV